jgi:hypothetical protein
VLKDANQRINRLLQFQFTRTLTKRRPGRVVKFIGSFATFDQPQDLLLPPTKFRTFIFLRQNEYGVLMGQVVGFSV